MPETMAVNHAGGLHVPRALLTYNSQAAQADKVALDTALQELRSKLQVCMIGAAISGLFTVHAHGTGQGCMYHDSAMSFGACR